MVVIKIASVISVPSVARTRNVNVETVMRIS